MTRSVVRRRLALEWWVWLVIAVAPLLLLKLLGVGADADWPALHMPLFIVGLLTMFISLPLFNRYKHGLIATQAALDSPGEVAAWTSLATSRRSGLLGAALPAWIAALASLSGLNAVALILLVLASLVIGYLYRIPPQLG